MLTEFYNKNIIKWRENCQISFTPELIFFAIYFPIKVIKGDANFDQGYSQVNIGASTIFPLLQLFALSAPNKGNLTNSFLEKRYPFNTWT